MKKNFVPKWDTSLTDFMPSKYTYGRFIDRTNTKIGDVEVLYPIGKNEKNIIWKAICNKCNTYYELTHKYLSRNNYFFCNCNPIKKKNFIPKWDTSLTDYMPTERSGKFIDLTHQKFDDVTVLYPTRDKYNGAIVWVCECKCGNKLNLVHKQLYGNNNKCECIIPKWDTSLTDFKIQTKKFKDITRERFGKLIALYPVKDNSVEYYSVKWVCKCDCGNTISVLSTQLHLTKGIQSCGCSCRNLIPKWDTTLTDFIPKQEHSFKDLTGQKIGKLEVLYPVKKNDNPNLFWMCKCDCGNSKEIRVVDLINRGKKGSKISCGCYREYTGTKHHAYRGYKEISKSYFTSIRRSALERNLEFNITIEEIYNLFIIQNKKCKLSGIEISLKKHNKSASLDRIDSSKGYVIDNVQWVCIRLNLMKQSLSDEEFIKWCTLVADNHKKK